MSKSVALSWEEEEKIIVAQAAAQAAAQASAQTELRSRRDALLAFLEGRFGALPDALVRRIDSTDDPERLKNWIHQAGRINSIEELKL